MRSRPSWWFQNCCDWHNPKAISSSFPRQITISGLWPELATEEKTANNTGNPRHSMKLSNLHSEDMKYEIVWCDHHASVLCSSHFDLHQMDRIEYGRRGGSGCWWVLGRCWLWGEALIKARLQEGLLFCSTNWGCHCSSFKVHSWIKHMHRSVLVLAQITQTCNKLKKCSLNAKEDHMTMWN